MCNNFSIYFNIFETFLSNTCNIFGQNKGSLLIKDIVLTLFQIHSQRLAGIVTFKYLRYMPYNYKQYSHWHWKNTFNGSIL